MAVANGSVDIGMMTGANFNDGDQFLINDGIQAVLFEFDKNGSCINLPTRRCINFVDTPVPTSTDEMRANIATAIAGSSLNIDVPSVTPSSVLLLHQEKGEFGNQPIIEQVNNVSFRVTGMAGGRARNCPQGTTCARHDDCARTLSCKKARISDLTGVCGP